MNPRQAAEYRDAISRMRLEPKPPARAKKSRRTPEAELVAKLLKHGVCPDSVIDPREVARCVARTVLEVRG